MNGISLFGGVTGGSPLVVTALVGLAFMTCQSHLAVAASAAPTITCRDVCQSTPIEVNGYGPPPPGYDFIHQPFRGNQGFSGGGDIRSPQNKTATTNKKRNKDKCQGYTSDPVEVDDGAKLLSIPFFRLPGEMGLRYTLYYHSKTGSAEDDFEPWASNIGYVLDTNCAVTSTSTLCDMVTLYRPDGSSVSFSGNYTAYGSFQEIGGGGLATLVHNSTGTWTLHDADATVQIYNSAGHLTSIRDASGIGWIVSSSSENSFGVTVATTTVTQTDGQTMTIVSEGTHTATSASRSVTVEDPAGNYYIYTETGYKNTNGILVFRVNSLTLPGSSATKMTFNYIDNGDLLSEVDYNDTPY